MHVHTKRRNRLLHDRMKDLVFVKFNSRLKQKRDNKDKDPIEKPIHDVVLEDEDNEWITGIEPTVGDEEQEKQTEAYHKELQLHLKEKRELRELTNRN